MRSGFFGCSGRSATTSLCSAARRRPTRAAGRSAVVTDRLRRAVGFRNVLVHDYIEVDDGVVLERLANLADLDDFVAVVAAWVVPPRS